MYTTGEIAANLCLETPGLDTLDIVVLWGGIPTNASTQTIFNSSRPTAHYLEQNEYVELDPEQGLEVVVPGQHETGARTAVGRHVAPGLVQARSAGGQLQGAGGVFDARADERRAADRRSGAGSIKDMAAGRAADAALDRDRRAR